MLRSVFGTLALATCALLAMGCRRTPPSADAKAKAADTRSMPAPVVAEGTLGAPLTKRTSPSGTEPPPIVKPRGHDGPAAKPPPADTSSKKASRITRVTDASEAQNEPEVGLFLAERLDYVDRVVTLRVRAEIGSYFNCYYKGLTSSYYHLRLRGDGSAYLDGYLPKGPEADALWLRVQKQVPYPLTVRVVMRATTVSNVCSGQVEILDAEDGWDFTRGTVAETGARARFLANQHDTTPPANRPPLDELVQMRRRFVGKSLTLTVRARLDRYYQCRYADAERTHYALFLQGDGFTGLRAFIPRDDDGRKLARMLASNEGGRLTVDVTVPEGRFDELCPDQVEVTGWRPGWGGEDEDKPAGSK